MMANAPASTPNTIPLMADISRSVKQYFATTAATPKVLYSLKHAIKAASAGLRSVRNELFACRSHGVGSNSTTAKQCQQQQQQQGGCNKSNQSSNSKNNSTGTGTGDSGGKGAVQDVLPLVASFSLSRM